MLTPSAIFDPSPSLRAINSFVVQIDAVNVQEALAVAPASNERHVIRTLYASTTVASTARLKIRNGENGDYIADFMLPSIDAMSFIGYIAADPGTALYVVCTGTMGGPVVLTVGMEVHQGS